MYGTKRVRVELDAPSHEALRYFGLLRGVPIGSVMRRALNSYASAVVEEFPAVKAHVAAKIAAAKAGPVEDDPDLNLVPF